jgi:hypothetical protein
VRWLRPTVLTGCIAVWVLAVGTWIALLAWERAWSSEACGLGGVGSDAQLQGEPSWSWLPPGVSCEYRIDTPGRLVEFTEDPPTARTGIAIVLILWGTSLAIVAAVPRVARPETPAGRAQGDDPLEG